MKKSFALLAFSGAFGLIGCPAFAACCAPAWIPYGSFMIGGQHLGLGSGYPGLFPHGLGLPPFEYPCVPDWQVMVVPSPPVQINIYPQVRRDEGEASRRAASEPGGGKVGEEAARARRLYPGGLPPVEYVWSPGKAVIRLRGD